MPNANRSMSYFETGTEVPFTAGDKVGILTVALQGQNIGIVGILRVPGTVDALTISMLNNFTQQNLTGIATKIGTDSSTTIKYMKMSWNLSGSRITDLVIGLVVTINTVPNNGQDLINAVMVWGPLQYLLSQIPPLGYDAYIVGTPPVGTYHQTITLTVSTDKSIPLSSIISEYGTEQQAKDTIRNQILADAQAKYKQALADQGYEANVISVTILNMEFIKDQNNNCKLSITMELVVDTNKPMLENTLSTTKTFLFWFIIIAIVIIILAISVPILLFDWFKSMTTKTATVTEKKYGWIVDPVTGARTWGVISESTSTETGPDYGGILMVAIGGVVLIGGLYVVSKLVSGRKKE